LRAGLDLPEAAAPADGENAADRVPLGPGAVATLRAALRQAPRLGHNYIGTEHILLGLVDGEDATAATLARLGVTRAGAQEQISAAFAAMRASLPGSGA
jgi:ATP-dependent Clp protease ATP-binding subunit ClpA